MRSIKETMKSTRTHNFTVMDILSEDRNVHEHEIPPSSHKSGVIRPSRKTIHSVQNLHSEPIEGNFNIATVSQNFTRQANHYNQSNELTKSTNEVCTCASL